MANINLMLGDCMDLMASKPDKYYSLAIVDPPYGIGGDSLHSERSLKGAGKLRDRSLNKFCSKTRYRVRTGMIRVGLMVRAGTWAVAISRMLLFFDISDHFYVFNFQK